MRREAASDFEQQTMYSCSASICVLNFAFIYPFSVDVESYCEYLTSVCSSARCAALLLVFYDYIPHRVSLFFNLLISPSVL